MNQATDSLPNLLICGVTKGGTTSLYSLLASHPGIAGGKVKEACHFLTYRFNEPPLPLDDYRKNYEWVAGKAPYLLDATPGYFFGGEKVIAAIRDILGPAKAIVVLRDPVERVWSFYRYMKSMMKIDATMTFDQYLDACRPVTCNDMSRREDYPFSSVAGGHYMHWLPAWKNAFGDDLKIFFIDDLRARPYEMLAGIEDWLGLPHRLEEAPNVVENRTIAFRFARLHALGLAINKFGEPFFRRVPVVKRTIRSLYNSINEKKEREKPSAQATERLQREYAASNRALKEFLGQIGQPGIPQWLERA